MKMHAVVAHDIDTNTALPLKLKLKTDRKFIAHSIVGKTNAIYEEVGVRKLFQRLCHQLLRTPEAEHT